MTKTAYVEPHTEVDVTRFAEELDIPLARAHYIEYMRTAYLCQEHEYTYNPKKVVKKKRNKYRV